MQMKKLLLNSRNRWKTFFPLLIILSFLSASCSSEEEKKLEAFSPEAFAYDLGNGWEVNASTFVKGFRQEKEGENYTALLSFDLDLVPPKGDTIKSLISRTEDKKSKEEMIDAELEAQFVLDSTYAPGKYSVIFRIKDGMTNRTAVSTAGFEISEE
jgi:hypothetical protein